MAVFLFLNIKLSVVERSEMLFRSCSGRFFRSCSWRFFHSCPAGFFCSCSGRFFPSFPAEFFRFCSGRFFPFLFVFRMLQDIAFEDSDQSSSREWYFGERDSWCWLFYLHEPTDRLLLTADAVKMVGVEHCIWLEVDWLHELAGRLRGVEFTKKALGQDPNIKRPFARLSSLALLSLT